MTVKDIKFKIETLKHRLEVDHFDHEKRRWVGADEKTRQWIFSSIEQLTKMLPRASHDDDVRRYGWRSVERNA